MNLNITNNSGKLNNKLQSMLNTLDGNSTVQQSTYSKNPNQTEYSKNPNQAEYSKNPNQQA